jgi:hypothetical protein
LPSHIERQSSVQDQTNDYSEEVELAELLREALYYFAGSPIPSDAQQTSSTDKHGPSPYNTVNTAGACSSTQRQTDAMPDTSRETNAGLANILRDALFAVLLINSRLEQQYNGIVTSSTAAVTPLLTRPLPEDLADENRYPETADPFERRWDVISKNHSKEHSFLGIEMVQLFCEVLYGHRLEGNPRQYHAMDTTYGTVSLFIPPSHLLRSTKVLVDYMEQGKGDRPIQDFLLEIRKIPEWTFSKETEVRWQQLLSVVGI